MKRSVLPTVLCAVVFCVAFNTVMAGPPLEPPSSPLRDPNSDVFVTVVDENNQPIAGAVLTYSDRHDAPTFVSDARGVIRIDRKIVTSLYEASFWITAPGFGSIYRSWYNEASPPGPETKMENKHLFRMLRHTHLEGTVLNELKKPVAGATVVISYDFVDPRQQGKAPGQVSKTTVTTDQNGKWVCDSIPGDVTILDVTPSHPDYASWGGYYGSNSLAQTAQTPEGSIFYGNRADRSRFLPDFTQTLALGTDVVIRVTDESGKPIAGATVSDLQRFGQRTDAQKFTSDANGMLKLPKRNRMHLGYHVKAQGFAPQYVEFQVQETPVTLMVPMSRGHKLRIRVTDKNGQPVPDVYVGLSIQETQSSSFLLEDDGVPRQTDANGIWEWAHVPNKEANLQFSKEGYLYYYNDTIATDASEYAHVMQKQPVISGRVIDAETKKPIERFNAILMVKQNPQYGWGTYYDSKQPQNAMLPADQSPQQYPDGRFERVWGAPFDSMYVRIKAPGYDMADSQVFKMGVENVTFNFELKPNPNIVGTVLRPDGTPAAGAEVAVGSKGNSIYINNGVFDRERMKNIVKTDAQGKFAFPYTDGQYSLVVLHESGSAVVRKENFDLPRAIHLSPFAAEPNGVVTTVPARYDCVLDGFSFGKGGYEKFDGYEIITTHNAEIAPDGKYHFGRLINCGGEFYYSEPCTIYKDDKQELVYPTHINLFSPRETLESERQSTPYYGKAIIPDEWKEAVKTSVAYLYFEPRDSMQSYSRNSAQFNSPGMPTVTDIATPPVFMPRLIDIRRGPYEYARAVTEEIKQIRLKDRFYLNAPFRERVRAVPVDAEGNFRLDTRMGDVNVYLFLRPKEPAQQVAEDKWVAKCYWSPDFTTYNPSPLNMELHPNREIYLLTAETIKQPSLPEKLTLHLVDENNKPLRDALLDVQCDDRDFAPKVVAGPDGKWELTFPADKRDAFKTFFIIGIVQRQPVFKRMNVIWERKGGKWERVPSELTVQIPKQTERPQQENTSTLQPATVQPIIQPVVTPLHH